MSMLNEQEAKKLIDKILSYSKADEISVTLIGGRTGNIRYARNTVSTNGETDNLSVSVTSFSGKRSGTATGNEFDDASLEKMVRRSEEIAKLAPENPEYLPALGPQQYGQALNYSENTARIDPVARVESALASIQACMATKTTAAGYLEDTTGFLAIGNSKGLFGYNQSTGGEFTVTARTADEKGSGYGVSYFTDATKLDTKSATEVAIKKAVASKEAKEVKPEKFTVILEPQAAYDLISLLVNAMDARSADEGRSYFGKRGSGNRIGDQLFNEKVTIISDPFNAENPSGPFAPDGRPRSSVTWVDKGVLKALPYTRYWAAQKKVDAIPPPAGFMVQGTDQTLQDLVRGTDKGILVTRFYYIRLVDPQTLVYTGLTRDGTFLIEKGEVKHAIKNFRFNESPANMLANLEAAGRPVRINNSMIPPMKIRDFNFTSLSDAV
ncbi:MAG TPA: TldD/PmbA family protein [Flavisolibacter sp.]